ncbi:imidazoleglycerol-phosphate dehydratase HisB [Pseudoramibacter alactolyticus]
MSRSVTLSRETKETRIALTLNLDGSGRSDIHSSVPFFDHMLTLFAAHGRFDLNVSAKGDGVDNHHVIEDLGILLGQAFAQALDDKAGITRYATEFLPMDESLCRINVDISGRATLVWDVTLTREMIGDFETEMLREFFIAFAHNATMTIHVASLYGVNNHHIVEGIFKGFGRALKTAVAIDPTVRGIPSTKGVIA